MIEGKRLLWNIICSFVVGAITLLMLATFMDASITTRMTEISVLSGAFFGAWSAFAGMIVGEMTYPLIWKDDD